jgi:GYF domain 2/Domain of unknown function (DUF4190)
MYRIIGSDGKEYGPVPAEQLRQWIREGRANAETRVVAEGNTEWKPLGSFPEFSILFTTPPPRTVTPPTIGAGSPVGLNTNACAVTGLVLGILSITGGLCCCYGVPFNIAGLIFSLVGLAQINNHPELYNGKGMAVAGLILSGASLLLAVAMIALVGASASWREMTRHMHRL